MRILLLTHYWAPEIGAPQRRWQWLARGLADRGHELAVLAPAPHYPQGRLLCEDPCLQPGAICRDSSSAIVHRTAFRSYDSGIGSRSLDQAVAAADAMRLGLKRFTGTHKPDVIVASVPVIPTLFAATGLSRALDVPLVVEMRDAWPDLLDSSDRWNRTGLATGYGISRPRRFATRAAKRAIRQTMTHIQRQAAGVVTTTESFADALRDRGVRRVVTVRNISDSRLWNLPSVQRSRATGTLNVLYLGTTGRAQGLCYAIRAAARTRDLGVALRMRIVGSGAQHELLQEEARRLDAPVEFFSPVASREVIEHYTWADSVLVSLQDWPALSMTVPSKLYEVMATGRHISAALSGEAAEIVTQTGAGDVVAPQDAQALARLWHDLAYDRSLLKPSSTAQSWLDDNASPSVMTQRFEELLRQVSDE